MKAEDEEEEEPRSKLFCSRCRAIVAMAVVGWLLAIGTVWGITNALIKRGALIADARKDQRREKAEETDDDEPGVVGSFLHDWFRLLCVWEYSLPFLVNLSMSVLFVIKLGDSPITLAVPVTNATTFAVTALAGAALGEKMRVLETVAGVSLIIAGVSLCISSPLAIFSWQADFFNILSVRLVDSQESVAFPRQPLHFGFVSDQARGQRSRSRLLRGAALREKLREVAEYCSTQASQGARGSRNAFWCLAFCTGVEWTEEISLLKSGRNCLCWSWIGVVSWLFAHSVYVKMARHYTGARRCFVSTFGVCSTSVSARECEPKFAVVNLMKERSRISVGLVQREIILFCNCVKLATDRILYRCSKVLYYSIFCVWLHHKARVNLLYRLCNVFSEREDWPYFIYFWFWCLLFES